MAADAPETNLPKLLYTLDEAADMLCLSRAALYTMVKDRAVPFRKIKSRGVAFTQTDLQEIIDAAHRPAVIKA